MGERRLVAVALGGLVTLGSSLDGLVALGDEVGDGLLGLLLRLHDRVLRLDHLPQRRENSIVDVREHELEPLAHADRRELRKLRKDGGHGERAEIGQLAATFDRLQLDNYKM